MTFINFTGVTLSISIIYNRICERCSGISSILLRAVRASIFYCNHKCLIYHLWFVFDDIAVSLTFHDGGSLKLRRLIVFFVLIWLIRRLMIDWLIDWLRYSINWLNNDWLRFDFSFFDPVFEVRKKKSFIKKQKASTKKVFFLPLQKSLSAQGRLFKFFFCY